MGRIRDRLQRTNGIEQLKEALREPRERVPLTAVARDPYPDEQGALTAVVPFDLYDAEMGDSYGNTSLEFEVRDDDGRERFDAFLDACGASVETLEDVPGTAFEARRDDSGSVVVDW